MSSCFFSDPGVVTDLLAVCRAEGWLLPAAEKKVRLLLQQGLHPEQALLGAHLLSLDEYGEALEQVFGVPFVSASAEPSSMLSLVPSLLLAHHRARVVDGGPTRALVAFADPSCVEDVQAMTGMLKQKGVELVPAVTLWSELRRLPAPSSSHSVARSRRVLEGAWRKAGTYQFELSHVEGGACSMHVEGRESVAGTMQPSSAMLSALGMHWERLQEKGAAAWQVRTQRLGHGTIVSGQAARLSFQAIHPLAWSRLVRAFFDSPRGVLVCLQGDSMASSFFAEQTSTSSARVPFSPSSSSPLVYAEEAEEEAFHAALAGRSVLFSAQREPTWLPQLVSLGVPVTLARRHPVAGGMSWSVLSL